MRLNDDEVVKDLNDAEGEIKVHYCRCNKSKDELKNSDCDRIIRDSNNVIVRTKSYGRVHQRGTPVLSPENREKGADGATAVFEWI